MSCPDFPYVHGKAFIALKDPNYFVWDSSVIYAEGKYHLFVSRWPSKMGFGANWLFNGEIVRAVSDSPEGPFKFQNVVLGRRGREYWDGMNVHNAHIKYWNGKYYLYYMGTTYGAPIQSKASDISQLMDLEVWNKKRLGVAVADRIEGPYVRFDKPLIEPRDCRYWDCTITTNPSVAILPDGTTYLIYKSRSYVMDPMRLGICKAPTPIGPFERLSDDPILNFSNKDKHMEDPFIWWDDKRKRICLIAKDDPKNGDYGITGEWGAGFYAESSDGIHFEIPEHPKVYSREITYLDGTKKTHRNLERPSLIFDQKGEPAYIYCAAGDGPAPYDFGDRVTFVVGMKLEKR